MPYFDRLDYVSMRAQEHVYPLALEKSANCKIPKRAQNIRMLFSELTRILNFLLFLGYHGPPLKTSLQGLFIKRKLKLFLLQTFFKAVKLLEPKNFDIPSFNYN